MPKLYAGRIGGVKYFLDRSLNSGGKLSVVQALGPFGEEPRTINELNSKGLPFGRQELREFRFYLEKDWRSQLSALLPFISDGF